MFGLSYLKLGLVVAIGLALAGLFAWAEMERAGRAEAETKAATLAATVNELQAVNAANQNAIAELKKAAEDASVAAIADQARQTTITRTVTKWRDRIIHDAPRSDACNVATPRDADILAGVHAIIAAAADPNPSPAGAAAPGTDSGHPAPGPAGPDHDAGSVGPSNPGPGGVGSGAAVAPQGSPGLGGKLRAVIGH